MSHEIKKEHVEPAKTLSKTLDLNQRKKTVITVELPPDLPTPVQRITKRMAVEYTEK